MRIIGQKDTSYSVFLIAFKIIISSAFYVNRFFAKSQ